MHHLHHALLIKLQQHGNFTLFILLAVGILGLPIPEETLMILAGFLIAKGKFSLVPTVISAYMGSICGITLSYILGLTAGSYLLKKYGHWIGITPEKLKVGRGWFAQYGKWTLFFGYFIPGVRHLTGYIAGTALYPYKNFALIAYTGAAFWSGLFITLGYFNSGNLEYLIHNIHYDALFSLLALAVLLFYLLRRIY